MLQKRRAIRGSLTEWSKACGFEPAPHHRLLIEHLEDLAHGRRRRLMVFMPPGSAKSTYTSILFPAWYLAQPDAGNIIAASHSTELAERFGRKVRSLVTEHGLQLGYGLSADSQAAGRWSTATGREYFAAGVGVGIAGFRSKLSLIDDPFRSRQDADSKLIRDRVWDWYNDDLDTRLVPGGAAALVMTRWHDDDLAGRLIQRMNAGGEQWDIVSLPAIAEENDPLGRSPGQWLWEDGYGYAARLREKHATSDARSWSALYQQNPTPDTGDYFSRDWFTPVTNLPPRDSMRIYGASDYAVTQDGGDYTVHLVVGIDADARLYALDLWRGQTDSATWIDAWCDLVLKWKPLEWAEEGGQINASVGPFLKMRAAQKKAYTFRRQFPSRHDKAVRAQSIRGRISMQGFYGPSQAPWWGPFIDELLRFPAGVHDDQVDALGLVGQLLDHIQAPITPLKPPPRVTERDWFEEPEESVSWKVA